MPTVSLKTTASAGIFNLSATMAEVDVISWHPILNQGMNRVSDLPMQGHRLPILRIRNKLRNIALHLYKRLIESHRTLKRASNRIDWHNTLSLV